MDNVIMLVLDWLFVWWESVQKGDRLAGPGDLRCGHAVVGNHPVVLQDVHHLGFVQPMRLDVVF